MHSSLQTLSENRTGRHAHAREELGKWRERPTAHVSTEKGHHLTPKAGKTGLAKPRQREVGAGLTTPWRSASLQVGQPS